MFKSELNFLTCEKIETENHESRIRDFKTIRITNQINIKVLLKPKPKVFKSKIKIAIQIFFFWDSNLAQP